MHKKSIKRPAVPDALIDALEAVLAPSGKTSFTITTMAAARLNLTDEITSA